MNKREFLKKVLERDVDAIKQYLDVNFDTFTDGYMVKTNGDKELWKLFEKSIFLMSFTIEERKEKARKYKGSLKNCIEDHLGKVPIGFGDDF